jgi:UDP-N-acetylglucosamine--N-acetylmuramyl-(pentapeptide) pyrophosphoryl-undecaprenol N-acetylglucosamine transferase
MFIILAVGGTGGHLFPAQALAEELQGKDPNLQILFAGAHLDANRFLDKERFEFQEIASATPFRRNRIASCLMLLKGVLQSLKLLKAKKPDLVVGFGSYHSFPLLMAAKWLGIPFILFEADTLPGKVNRFFSRYARFTAVHFACAAAHLKGKSIPVCMPNRHCLTRDSLDCQSAREMLGLKSDCFTLLVFGGSQGAQGINQQVLACLPLFTRLPFALQLIHITGSKEVAEQIHVTCTSLGIACYAKDFEARMHVVWKASSLSVCRCGASTLAEMLHFEVPGIVIPYPYASDAHQEKNAQFLEKEVQGGICLLEKDLTADKLCACICACEKNLENYKASMHHYKKAEDRKTLGQAIYEYDQLH